MGEETTFKGIGQKFFFCIKEDIGTEREQWHEAKLENFKIREAIEVPELDIEKIQGEPLIKQSFTLAAEVERNESFDRFMRGEKKRLSGGFYYCRKLITKRQRKAIRKLGLIIKKHKFKRK